MHKFIKSRKENLLGKAAPCQINVVSGWSSSMISKELGSSAIYIGTDTLRSMNSTSSFFDFIRHGKIDVVLDECAMLKNELPGWKWIKENHVSMNGIRIFVPCSHSECALKGVRINTGIKETVSDTVHERDSFFENTRTFMEKLVTDKGQYDFDTFIRMNIDEPGNRMGIIQENYPSTKGITMDEMHSICELISQGDILDNAVYASQNKQSVYDIFNIVAIIYPSFIIRNRIPHKKMKSATAWTKDFNTRLKKSLSFHWKYSDPDTLQALREQPKLIQEYCTHSKGIHFINQVSLGKTINLKEIKKLLKEREQIFVE